MSKRNRWVDDCAHTAAVYRLFTFGAQAQAIAESYAFAVLANPGTP